jgi:hypothetical protein
MGTLQAFSTAMNSLMKQCNCRRTEQYRGQRSLLTLYWLMNDTDTIQITSEVVGLSATPASSMAPSVAIP